MSHVEMKEGKMRTNETGTNNINNNDYFHNITIKWPFFSTTTDINGQFSYIYIFESEIIVHDFQNLRLNARTDSAK